MFPLTRGKTETAEHTIEGFGNEAKGSDFVSEIVNDSIFQLKIAFKEA